MTTPENTKLAIVGLGYVGLPLAVEFGKKYSTVGYDLNTERVIELKSGTDSTLEVDADELAQAKSLSYTSTLQDISDCNVYIVTVPTPIDDYNSPDLTPLKSASKAIGSILKKDDIVIYESTVFPGATEDECVPILERESGLSFNEHFFAGYSPERINPGDKEHRVSNILKVTSGSTPEIAEFIDNLYASIITAGTHKASSIKVAEASKVIENTQRDLNIALVNELALIFNKLGIDTMDVLEAAGTKWNFLPFKPGLVGGHCISVDPYYLTQKAESIGYHPDIILAGRRINDGMGGYVAGQVIRLMTQKRIHVVDSKVLILGLAFKENCPDLRNTRVIDIVHELEKHNAQVDIFDPWVNHEEALHEYGIQPLSSIEQNTYDAIVITVSHDEFINMGTETIHAFGKSNHIIYDVKHILPKEQVDGRL